MSNLFRKEVFDYKKTKSWEGDVALPNTFSLKILIFIVALILVSIILFFMYGSYTERRSVTGYLTPVNGLIQVMSPATGVVDSIKVKDSQIVKAGDELLTITDRQYGNQGSYSDQLNDNLQEQLDVIKNLKPIIQKDHNEKANIIKLEIEELEQQLVFNSNFLNNQHERIDVLEGTYNSYLNIGVEGAISELELQNVKSRFIDAKSELYRLQESRASLLSQIKSKKLALEQISNQKNKEINDLTSREISTRRSLLQLEKDSTRVVKSPVTGRLSALNIYENQMVSNSQLLLDIIPTDHKLKASLLVPPSDIGFIEVGNQVSIRYDAFPYQKYGQAKGNITSISKTTLRPSDLLKTGGYSLPIEENTSFYIVDVSLDKQSMSLEGAEKKLDTGMTLKADIKLENRKLYQWVLEPLISLKERNN